MSVGPYAGGGWCEDRPTRAEAAAEPPLPRTASTAPMTADPWALCPSCRQYVERLPADTCPTPEAHTWPLPERTTP